MLKTILNLNNEAIQRRVLVKRLMEDKTLFDISDHKIAKLIVRWCGSTENSIEFFSECLTRIGVEFPIRMVQLVKEKEYIVSIKEIGTSIKRDLYISKNPKEYLKLVTILGTEKVEFMQKANTLKIEYKSVNVKYFGEDSIRVSVGENIDIILKGYKWSKEENLYQKAKYLIRDLEKINKTLEPYEFYKNVKKQILQYYNLEGVHFEFSMDKFSLITQDSNLIVYNDPDRGILIKKYLKWVYKKYSRDGVEIIWEDNLKCNGNLSEEEKTKYLAMAEKAIEGVEGLEY